MVKIIDTVTTDVIAPKKRKAGRPKGTGNPLGSKSIASQFLVMCKQGLSLTQIADKLCLPKEQLERWSRDKVKHKEFVKAFELGKTAWQAYHETLLQKMISGQDGKYASAEISAQQFVLKTQFKSEWTEKNDSKIEISHVGRLTDDQLEQQILNLLGKSQIQTYILQEQDNKPKLVVNNDIK